MTHASKLSRLMKMSWEIQKNKRNSRSKSLSAAWTIITNEDVTIYYLVRRMSNNKPVNQKALNQISLFTTQNPAL